ncbi:MAG: glycosyltransferase family 9 protein [Verrucomicrobiales bacterium]|nr:glycosyltransferase family 9 protein [Verrucomicrobiales bacterium]
MHLVIKNDGIGDLVLASGLISDLAREMGPVDLLTCEANREIAENIPGLRRCLYVSRDAIHFQRHLLRIGVPWVIGTPQDRRVLRELQRTRYESAICLRRFIRQSSLALMNAVQADRRHCAWLFPTNASSALAAQCSEGWRHFRGPSTGSELSYFRAFVQDAMGWTPASPPRLRCAEGLEPRPQAGRVGLIISGASTNWPADHWERLTLELAKDGCRCVLFGGPEAVELGRRLAARVSTVENLVGQRTFAGSVPDLGRVSLVIGNDTGMTHFAALVAVRTLIVLGGGTFGRFFPWPDDSRQTVVFRAMECFDCDWQCRYPQRECMTQVQPDEVLEVARRLLQGERVGAWVNLNSGSVSYQPGWRRGMTDAGGAATVVIRGGTETRSGQSS